ncbi:MAG: hypothetical protein C0626_07180 [Arcobacter sp.]|uniref:5'-methylthioadenosine/S-adenosylhomocysteine nucleosidase family protein n=1 Tax=uncultured Arcobacter sp. TaxID=165434 RepID=UPI000CCA7405|nr:hypothetical protein [uncultured Arcobacter sp.]PLY09967.1 MAG: hypothetical protein C0626_07180 [Arcobacter sp.]
MTSKQINILIIDDKPKNIRTVRKVLNKNFGFLDENLFPKDKDIQGFVDEISSFVSSKSKAALKRFIKQYIYDNDIDLLILDFALSDDEALDGNDITSTSGYSLLDEFLEDENLWKLPIVAFTFLPLEDIKTKHKARYIATIKKQASNENDLITELIADLKNYDNSVLYSILYHGNLYKQQKVMNYDLAILCALKEEFDEVLKLPNEWKGKEIKDVDDNGWKKVKVENDTYFETVFLSSKNQQIRVIGKAMNDMGMVESATYSTKMIDNFNPKYITMTGIAAGIKDDDVEVGDIIIPQYNWNWQAGKFKTILSDEFDKEKNKFRKKIVTFFDKDMRQKELDTEIYDLVTQELQSNNDFFKNLFENFCSEYTDFTIPIIRDNKKRNRYPQVITEKMVSGSAVVADSKVINEIKQRKVVGLEMEAYGVFYAASKSKTKAVVLKAICDFADEAKDDEYHTFAAYSSARTMYKLFTEYIF